MSIRGFSISVTKLICVYCASSRKLDPKYYAVGEAVGRGLAEHGWGLIYGGGNVGTMGAVAKGVHDAGGHVVGVIPEFMKDRELAYDAADELVTVNSMRERKRVMAERADGFVTLPGGIGTLEEVSEIMVERKLGLTTKPLVLLNQDGFYDDLLRFLERAVTERCMTDDLPLLFGVANTIDEVWPLLKKPNDYQAGVWWK